MRSTSFFLLLLFLVAACQQNPTENTAQQLAAPVTEATGLSVSTEPTLAQRLSPVLSGYWVNADYLLEVTRTRSPAAAFDHALSGPSSLSISPFAAQKDSVEIGASYGLHEGGSLTLLLQPGSQPSSLKLRESYSSEAGTISEIAYQITPADTTLFYLIKKARTHQLVSKTAYRRTGIAGKNADLETGVERGINRLLLTGSYLGTDSIGQRVKGSFLIDGRLTGLPFKKYIIQTDFAGPGPGDEIIFDVYTKQRHEFAAVYGRDTVRLYTILSSTSVGAGEFDSANTFTRGHLRYELIRTKQP